MASSIAPMPHADSQPQTQPQVCSPNNKTAAGQAVSQASLATCTKTLKSRGFVVVPRETLGITTDEVAAIHAAQLHAAQAKLGVGPGWRDAKHVASLSPEEQRRLSKTLASGFLGLQLIPEQVRMALDSRVERLYLQVFRDLEVPRDSDRVWVNLERSNLSLPQPLRQAYKQKGAIPHVDINPWQDHQSPNDLYDYERWEESERGARRRPGTHLSRPWPMFRPVQAFLALTDCKGGAAGGGLGLSTEQGFVDFLRTSTPPHGRNPHWGPLTRIYPTPGGQTLASLSKAELQGLYHEHQRVLDGLDYPSYRAGDVLMWLPEVVHAGPRDNTTGAIQARMYLGCLPDCVLNRQMVRRQFQALVRGTQIHGRGLDRREEGDLRQVVRGKEERRRVGDLLEAEVLHVGSAAQASNTEKGAGHKEPGAKAVPKAESAESPPTAPARSVTPKTNKRRRRH